MPKDYWDPNEHYIWIEPNVKYELAGPDSWKYAPVPWYNRPPPPPPKPTNPPPPNDKLRFVSTRRIHHAFDRRGTRYTQTAADDLDSFSQTLLFAVLKRNGCCENLMRSLNRQSDKLDSLRKARDNVSDYFANMAQRQRDEEKSAMTETRWPPEGMQAMAQALHELMEVNMKHMEQEWNSSRDGLTDSERTTKRYDEYIEAMLNLKASAELGAERRRTRKAAQAVEDAQRKRDREQQELDRERHQDTPTNVNMEDLPAEAQPMEVDPQLQDQNGDACEEGNTLDEMSEPPSKRARMR